VSTSILDAAPGILFEGAVMGCNLVASPNCGNWKICHPELLVTDYRAEVFCNRIERSVAKKYPDNLDGFLSQGGLAELLRTLEEAPWRRENDAGA
jgi:hypothetical protein